MIVAFGTITKELLKGLGNLEVGGRVETIQMTARILRRVLETWRVFLSLKRQWKAISISWWEKNYNNNNNRMKWNKSINKQQKKPSRISIYFSSVPPQQNYISHWNGSWKKILLTDITSKMNEYFFISSLETAALPQTMWGDSRVRTKSLAGVKSYTSAKIRLLHIYIYIYIYIYIWHNKWRKMNWLYGVFIHWMKIIYIYIYIHTQKKVIF